MPLTTKGKGGCFERRNFFDHELTDKLAIMKTVAKSECDNPASSTGETKALGLVSVIFWYIL